MPDAGFVPGDVRGFTMLHHHPEEKLNSKKQPYLIDFDISGIHQKTSIHLVFHVKFQRELIQEAANRANVWNLSMIGRNSAPQCCYIDFVG
jgi:hypothetical protein